jgi:N-acetylneuraminate synthase
MTEFGKNRVFIIAEAGVNHNGSLDQALALVDVAAEAGADAVKFQTFRADRLASKSAPKAEYQLKTTSASESQWEMLKRLELSREMHESVIDRCEQRNLEFMSTPFDTASLDLLVELSISRLKLGSGEVTNGPLLVHAATMQKPIILSTGMSTLKEVALALSALAFGYVSATEEPSIEAFQRAYVSTAGQNALRRNLTLLHCTTEYPAEFNDVNLRAIDTLCSEFGLPVGFSDHSRGITASIAAVARGACVIEKHVTLDRNMEGPDHKASLEPDEFRQMVQAIRDVEACLGSALKGPVECEIKNIAIARKSLVAERAVRAGEQFSSENLGVKRPGGGISPMFYWRYLGQTADRDYGEGEIVQ